MTWHATGKSTENDKMQHHVDGKAWKNFYTRYPNFVAEPSDIRLGLATDGFNPFGNLSVETIDAATSERHMARQCTQPKRPRNAAWFKNKAMLAEAHEFGQILDEEKLAFLADPGIPDGQAAQKTIPNNAALKTEDLDAYDSDCDDVSNAKVVLMANLSNYGYDVISEVPHSESYHNAMDNQSVHEMQNFEQTLAANFLVNEITSGSNIIPYSQYLQETQQEKANQEKNNESLTVELARYKERVKTFKQRLNIDLSTREKIIDSQIDEMIKEKLTLKQQIESLEQKLSNQIKERESLLQTFTVFKNESKEKESKYIDKEIDLEKKIKELDNIVYKVGQSAQTKAQRIKPTLYDGSVISSQHAVIPVIDNEETLILEEVSRSKMLAKQNDPVSKEKKINTTPINYVELNQLSEDFGKCFVPQQELSADSKNNYDFVLALNNNYLDQIVPNNSHFYFFSSYRT
ncbi:retrovirus-related pol polyprotein from transposon TNT 1-94 [Tanacetum coccineum]|uniref:Retrovirus-related pol polyprotein from transposon TNT 1-94 n=1 Tax=Tanacetum coccineum TaxID=301880 RepID=A0ABQ5DJ03_9ASTR